MSTTLLSVSLGNRFEELEPTRQAVLAGVQPLALKPDVVFRLELVLEEVLMNLLWHAFKDGDAQTIRLTVQSQDDEVVLGFIDSGVPFDPTQHRADQPRPKSVAEAPLGGRGLALMRSAAKRIEYKRSGQFNHLSIAIATT